MRPRERPERVVNDHRRAFRTEPMADAVVTVQVVILENVQGDFLSRLVDEFDPEQVVVSLAMRGQIFNDPERMSDVFLLLVPSKLSLPATVVPTILAAGNA